MITALLLIFALVIEHIYDPISNMKDTLVINSIPNCPDCTEQLILIAEDYILPDDFNNPSTNIYAFYTDSLGNPAGITADHEERKSGRRVRSRGPEWTCCPGCRRTS